MFVNKRSMQRSIFLPADLKRVWLLLPDDISDSRGEACR